MNWSLFTAQGHRKYLTPLERAAFIEAASRIGGETGLFCLALAVTGARISEVLQVTGDRLDEAAGVIVVETLKRRKRGIYRAVPVPRDLIQALQNLPTCEGSIQGTDTRLWRWSRTTAWKRVKTVMREAGLDGVIATPRALRHGFAVGAVQKRIALSVIKKWLGHSKIETTAIYADPTGPEERELA